ncbi:hypothetical protein H0I76_00290 [Limibaculum sp. M0105]|uniref:SCP domain-containing protein n=1 Tax=Thermohalobaculum xanthum TaxID=2753746 RepID=A0A8J7M597_9RHOB|nr:CAP domain-containing protein [Thermohalobaculum xanthum]MBK0397614.1 hypothetical protein [Thermohalobaculum xanthum]
MREPTAEEQLLIELINRARLDPVAEAERYGISLDDGLDPGTISLTPKDPLAVSLALNDAAYQHSVWMLEADVFSHVGEGGSRISDRAAAVDYSWRQLGENLSWIGTTGPLVNSAALIEQHHRNLFLSSGHRANMLNEAYVELGVGQALGKFTLNGTVFNASMLSEMFASPSSGARFFTGVVIDDLDGDDFYDIGEGLGGVTVTATGAAGSFSTLTFASGGYSLAVPDGSYTVTFSGGDLSGSVTLSAVMAGHNVKIDAEQADAVLAAMPQGTQGDDVLAGTEVADEIDGFAGHDVITGAGGDDILRGGIGWDQVWGDAGSDYILGGAGADLIWGGDGDDRLEGGFWHDTLWGGAGADSIGGGFGDDVLYGEGGDDTLSGGLGDDLLSGGDGDDYLAGDAGNDVLEGGAGTDDLWGGIGDDRFVFGPSIGMDRVWDFDSDADTLDFTSATGVSGLGDLALTQAGADTIIDLPDGGRIILIGVSPDLLEPGALIV